MSSSGDDLLKLLRELVQSLVDNPIAVGPGVTPRPPHRSRRAEFPHRAPQMCSLAVSELDCCRYEGT